MLVNDNVFAWYYEAIVVVLDNFVYLELSIDKEGNLKSGNKIPHFD